jgi:cell division protein FtsA
MEISSLEPKIYGVLDVGTSAIRTVIAQPLNHGWNILGWGAYPSSGMKKGNIIDFEKLYRATQSSWDQAWLHASINQCDLITTNLCSTDLSYTVGHCELRLGSQKVQDIDIKKMKNMMESTQEKNDQKILHILSQSYHLDEKDITNPVGQYGSVLEWKALTVRCSAQPLSEKMDLLSRLHLSCDYPIADAIASAQSVLSVKERHKGVLQIDLGAGFTKWSVHHNHIMKNLNMIPIGGDQLTADIALALKTSLATAEVLKVRYACVKHVSTSSVLFNPLFHDRNIILDQHALHYLNQVITMRLEEMLSIVVKALQTDDTLSCIHSIVLSGGLSQLSGLSELTEQIFDLPVRIGTPLGLKDKHPFLQSASAATLMGLLEAAREQEISYAASHKPTWKQWFHKIQNWIA